jgi:predicted aspartyl protease
MRKFLFGVLLIAVITPFSERGAQAQSDGGDSLASFLTKQGFTRTPVNRLPHYRLWLAATINQKTRALLMVATACPISGIDQSSAVKFGLAQRQTAMRVQGSLGSSNERYRMSEVKSLALANGALTNVRVAVLNLSGLNGDQPQPHMDGVFGYAEMRRLGAVLDCAHQMLYMKPPSARGETSVQLQQYLVERGFTRVPMRLDSSRHFVVDCVINGHASKMTVDTASVFTCINPRTAAKAGVSSVLTSMNALGAGGRRAQVRSGRGKELSIGNFRVANADLVVVDVSFDTLGIEYLSFNSAVIDIEGASLYLRHSSKR